MIHNLFIVYRILLRISLSGTQTFKVIDAVSKKIKNIIVIINLLTSPGEVVTVFTSPYLSAGAPALGEAKGLML